MTNYNTIKRCSIPERIHDGALLLVDMLVVPMPRLRVDRLADTAEDAQT